MTDVSTYIEAEDYEAKFYEKYSDVSNQSYVDTHTAICGDNPIFVEKDKRKINISITSLVGVDLSKNCNPS